MDNMPNTPAVKSRPLLEASIAAATINLPLRNTLDGFCYIIGTDFYLELRIDKGGNIVPAQEGTVEFNPTTINQVADQLLQRESTKAFLVEEPNLMDYLGRSGEFKNERMIYKRNCRTYQFL